MKSDLDKRGFTLIELLIVIAIISILSVIFVVSANPREKRDRAHNAQRWADSIALANAIRLAQLRSDNEAIKQVDNSWRMIGTAESGCDITCGPVGGKTVEPSHACIDLTHDLSYYMVFIPYDPLSGSPERTKFAIRKDASNQILVKSCAPAMGVDITVSR